MSIREQLETWSKDDLVQLRIALAHDLMGRKQTEIKEALEIYNNSLPLTAFKKTVLNEKETLDFITQVIVTIVTKGE